jgi:STE24 endopeptidase
LFSIFMMMFYSSLIVPIFNKQTPLEKWELRDAIEEFAKKVWFKLDNIFVIDGSKRSSKANAYFSWFWPKKRIVLYDTLINDLDINELVWVLAHEIWHYKKKHTFYMLTFSIIQTGFMLYIFWLALNISEVSLSLWATKSSFHIASIAFWILFTPISMVLWFAWNILSRRNEYEADKFAWINFEPKHLKNALIKLSRKNLSNLRPHPIYELFNYSHPTVLKRLKALEQIEK